MYIAFKHTASLSLSPLKSLEGQKLSWGNKPSLYFGSKVSPSDAVKAKELLDKYCQMYAKDFYVNENIYPAYLSGQFEAVDLNSASLAPPFKPAKAGAYSTFLREDRLTENEKQHIIKTAREKAAQLVNLPDSRGVVLARNTTEAASFVYWLANLNPGDNVVLTNADNVSLQRLFELHMDHGNPKRQDGWSTFPTWYCQRGQRYADFVPNKTGILTHRIEVIDSNEAGIRKQLENAIDSKTKAFVFSHVLRDTGRELPVKAICDMARQIKARKNPLAPDLFILVDGAQALGNVPKISFDELGCDAYLGTPHKTLNAGGIVGLLYFNPQNPRIKSQLHRINQLSPKTEQVVLQRMFDDTSGIIPNVQDSLSCADLVGFSEAVKHLEQLGLKGNDFSAIVATRQRLKDYFMQQFKALDLDVRVPAVDNPTSFIFSFQLPGQMGKALAKKLSENGVFLSYIERSDAHRFFRVSFNVENTPAQIDKALQILKQTVKPV